MFDEEDEEEDEKEGVLSLKRLGRGGVIARSEG